MGDHGSKHDGAISGDPSSAQGSLPLNRDTDIVLSLADINKNMGQMASWQNCVKKNLLSHMYSHHTMMIAHRAVKESQRHQTNLTLSAKRPRHSSSDTIFSWVKTVLESAEIDTSKYSAHSCFNIFL